jgi:hypothetical protein
MSTNAGSERVTAGKAASVHQNPPAVTGAPPPEGSPVVPGWMAGRMIDGVETVVDGKPPKWSPPRWLRELEAQGYDRTAEGEPTFVVTHVSDGDLRGFPNVRDALRYGRSLIQRRRAPVGPDSLAIDCRTPSGRVVLVVADRAFLGMAQGALDNEPITVISAPSEILPGRPRD